MTTKLFFFDLEGTLIHNRDNRGDGSLWGRIPQVLGPESMQEDERMYAKWNAGAYRNYTEWCDESMAASKRFGLTYAQFTALLDEAVVSPGVVETISELHSRGIITAIITGGFHEQAARLQRQLQVRHALAAVQIYWGSDGTIEGWNTLPADDMGKADFVELMRREYRCEKDECAFAGNGKNDVAIAKHVGTSFAVPNSHPSLASIATYQLTHFTDILRHLK